MTVKAKGIDVSKYQSSVDFTKVKAAGYSFVLIRVGYGKLLNQKDPMFETHYKNAKAAGLDVGAYWYSYASTVEETVQEAKVCLEAVKGKQFEYPIYYDMEERTSLNQGKNTVSDMVKAFCSYLENQGCFAGLYMSRSPLQTYITDTVAKKYALWIVEYGAKCNYSGSYGMWQKCSTGTVSGISGNVDLNECYVDYPAIIKNSGLNGFTKSASTSSTSSESNNTISYAKGTKVMLSDVTIYTSATASAGTKKSGTYYIYDGTEINGRMRITDASENIGKMPIEMYVTGWVKQSEILIDSFYPKK